MKFLKYLQGRITKYRWIYALLFGGYKQTQGTLKDSKGFCCLGVLCDISGLGQWEDSTYQTKTGCWHGICHTEVLGLQMPASQTEYRVGELHYLADLNDRKDYSFKQIAWEIFKHY